MVPSKEFFAQARIHILSCTADEGAFWAHGQFWLARGSPFNPLRRRVPLLSSYDEPRPRPPTPGQVDGIVALLGPTVSSGDRNAFEVQAAILRATAKEYYA